VLVMQLIPSYCSSFIALCLPFVSCNVVILVVHFDNDTFKWKSDQDHVFLRMLGNIVSIQLIILGL
jgi:hypothetical protein